MKSLWCKNNIFYHSKMEGGFARMYSCHLKRLSRVIFMKETVTARRKYVSYYTSRVKRLRQGQYGIHNVNPQSDWWADGTLLKQKGPLAPQKQVNNTVSWSCVCSATAELLLLLSPSMCFWVLLSRCCISFRWFRPLIIWNDSAQFAGNSELLWVTAWEKDIWGWKPENNGRHCTRVL